MNKLSAVVIDEIALEGLEGITLSSLWIYVGANLNFPQPLPDVIKDEAFKIIKENADLFQFFVLPVERPPVKHYNRFERVDSELGVLLEADPSCFALPVYAPIQGGKVMGSCQHYEKRKPIYLKLLQSHNVNTIQSTWGDKFVIVASQDQRINALMPRNVPAVNDLTSDQYCILEIVGRSRFNGMTTSGTMALTNFCKDSSVVFYIKNKLQRFGLIAQQTINEKRKGRLVETFLIVLPRFYTLHRSYLRITIEKIYRHLNETSHHRLHLNEVRSICNSADRPKGYKKLNGTHVFRRIFETQKIRVAELSDLEQKAFEKTTKNGKERLEPFLCLRNPHPTIDELFPVTNNLKADEDAGAEFFDEKHAYVDMNLKDECYRALMHFGPRGCSQAELTNYVCANSLNVRQFIKKLEADKLITIYNVDVGRQRIRRMVALEHSTTPYVENESPAVKLKQLKCAPEPNIPKSIVSVTLVDVPSIAGTIKPFHDKNYVTREIKTSRQLTRKSLIIEMVDASCIVQVGALRTHIQQTEKANGYKDEVCAKSVRRLLSYMVQEGTVCMYEMLLKFEEHSRSYRYVTHPKITIDHDVLRRELMNQKNNLFITLDDRRLRTDAQSNKQLERKTEATPVQKLPVNKINPPKFLISRHMHEFLFYTIFELSGHPTTGVSVNEGLLRVWQFVEPGLPVNDYLAQLAKETPKPLAYTQQISWRTFVPPLPVYEDKPAGWAYFMDVVDRLPLSIYNKIFGLDAGTDEQLSAYLAHPIRQHYLMRHLPMQIQCSIHRTQLQRVYIMILKLLNQMGLLQVSERQQAKSPTSLWIYLNRRAEILDTTRSEAGYMSVNPDRKYPRTTYEFRSCDDVQQYWTDLQRVCFITKLGLRRGVPSQSQCVIPKELQFLDTIDFEAAPSNDCGITPGDHMGAAGLAQILFAHSNRHWSWLVHSRDRVKALRSTVSSIHQRKIKLLKRKSRAHMPRPTKSLNIGATVAMGKRSSAKKSGPRDAIDRDALKNMRTLRVTWRKQEDDVLKMARAVYLYLEAPVAALGLLTVGRACRDIMRYALGTYNKTSQACVRRIAFICKRQRHLPAVPTWVHELQTNSYAQHMYGENFLQRLKRKYTKRADYCKALETHFVLLMCFLYKLVHDTHNDDTVAADTTERFRIPDTLAEFQRRFRQCSAKTDDDAVQYANPKDDFEVQVNVVTSVLHSTLSSAYDKTIYNPQAFEIYRHFSEEVMQTAFRKACKDSLVIAIKRNRNLSAPEQLSGPAYLLSSRYRKRLHFLKIPYQVYGALYAHAEAVLPTLIGSTDGTIELKSPHVGQFFHIVEGLSQNHWQLHIKLPLNILTIDADQPQSSTAIDRTLDHYQSNFENAPTTEYMKSCSSAPTTEKQVRVKFHPANRSYRIHYSPFDYLAKLSTHQLHFFCALDHLYRPVDIRFSELYAPSDETPGYAVIRCPFKCILRSGNYNDAIARIVQEQRHMLSQLVEMPPQQLLNSTNSVDAVTVQPANLLTLVRMLEAFWREKTEALECKDLGRLSAKIKVKRSIDWQELCTQIIAHSGSEAVQNSSNDKSDNCEPLLNKEERAVRAQDVFVVNLPILQYKSSAQLRNDREIRLHNGLAVPSILLQVDVQRESILSKVLMESQWKYTDNTFESVRKQLLQANRFSATEMHHLEEMHNFIEAETFGITAVEIMSRFSSQEFVLRGLQALRESYLIKRVGVATPVYVHKTHIRHWLVHTFHIKRLEREKLGSLTTSASLTKSAELDKEISDDNGPSCSKRRKVSESNGRASLRLANQMDQQCKAVDHSTPREIIPMRPQPWIRVNGSLNRRVLDKWLGAILTECIAFCGCSCLYICNSFPHMFPVDVLFLLEILSDLRCIRLTQFQKEKVSLCSEYADIQESIVLECYDARHTFVTAEPTAVTRMAMFIGKKKYNVDFA